MEDSMELGDGRFSTSTIGGTFDIIIVDETDISVDGGHTLEQVTNLYELDKREAELLMAELKAFIENK